MIRVATTKPMQGDPASGSVQLGSILVVDDDPGVCSFVKRALEREGYQVSFVHDGDAAERALDDPEQRFDLILLDVGLPTISGWEVLERRRAAGDETPVMFLSAQHEVPDRVRGLQLGADDYLQKPFRPEELSARIGAILRRHENLPTYRCGAMTLDLDAQAVIVGDRRVEVSPREFQVLLSLARARGQVRSRAALLKQVWELEEDPGTKLLEVQIARLRRKLAPEGRGLIQTVIGQGYRVHMG